MGKAPISMPPETEPQPVPAHRSLYTTPRDLRNLTLFLSATLLLIAVVEVAGVYCEYNQVAPPETLLLVGGAAAIIAVFVFLLWVHRANLNCWNLGAERMKYTPNWSIGCYFVPFLNFVWPYRSMREIWRVSHNPDDWESQDSGLIVAVWWSLWVFSWISGELALNRAGGEPPFDLEILATLADCSAIACRLLTVALVIVVANLQWRLIKQRMPAVPDAKAT